MNHPEIINLTADSVTLLSDKDEPTTLEPCGYVASIAMSEREERYLRSINGILIPVILENPRRIKFLDADGKPASHVKVLHDLLGGEQQLLVSREVAYAALSVAHTLQYNCAYRMVWANDEDTLYPSPGESMDSCEVPESRKLLPVIGYRELRYAR